MKKFLIISLNILISLSLVTGCGKKNKAVEDNNKLEPDTTEKEQNKEEADFSFQIVKLSAVDEDITIEVKVTNVSNIIANNFKVKIIVLNGENEIVNFEKVIEEEMKPNQSQILTNTYNGNILDITDINYEVIR